MNNKGVIIIGGHVQALGILRIFYKYNIPAIILDDKKLNIARFSKYCKGFIFYKYGQLLNKLIALGHSKNYVDWLVLPTNDLHVEILSKNKNLLGEYFKIGIDEWDRTICSYNKKITYTIAKKINIPIPETFFPNNIDEVIKLEINFPCIIKPAIMHTFYHSMKKKVLICKNRSELIKNYLLAAKAIPKDEIMVQEIIQGSSDNQFSACFFFKNKKPYVSLLAARNRQHPLDFGNATTFAFTIKESIIYDYAIKLLSEINFNGICEVEFKKDDRDNKYKLLEINPRTWKWHYIAEVSNSPFLISYYNEIYNLTPIECNQWEDACWEDNIVDLYVKFKMYLKGFNINHKCKNKIYAVYDKNDIKPFLVELLFLPYFIFSR